MCEGLERAQPAGEPVISSVRQGSVRGRAESGVRVCHIRSLSFRPRSHKEPMKGFQRGTDVLRGVSAGFPGGRP